MKYGDDDKTNLKKNIASAFILSAILQERNSDMIRRSKRFGVPIKVELVQNYVVFQIYSFTSRLSAIIERFFFEMIDPEQYAGLDK